MTSPMAAMKSSIAKLWRDTLIKCICFGVIIFSIVIFSFSILLGVVIILFFFTGLVLASTLLENKQRVSQLLQKVIDYFGYKESKSLEDVCDVCGSVQCSRHQPNTSKEPWRSLLIDKSLDNSIDKFFSKILNSFVNSWFSQLSNDERFINLLKQSLRDATCRLVLKIKQVDAPILITNKLLPCVFDHYEITSKMLKGGVSMDKLGSNFILKDIPIHPACCNRSAEIRYLRIVAKNLIPKLLHNDYHDSKVFFSLIRELFACWVLLPLLDVISDPNLLNLLVIVATDPPSNKYDPKETEKVAFLDSFVDNFNSDCDSDNEEILSDQTKLYSFMQFLKREGAVDVLRFHLDVDNLNSELLDPRITTDPAKLSALYQQSENLLNRYQLMAEKNLDLPKVDSLNKAHEVIKKFLYGKWSKAYHKTPEYFELAYGSRQLPDLMDGKGDMISGTVSKFSKLKGVIRGAVDGAPIEATEVPTVWDAFNDQPFITSQNSNSSTQKLKKEKSQNLDSFMVTFIQSIEQTMDIGEDVILMHEPKNIPSVPNPPGRNLVFGDLFEMRKPPNSFAALKYGQHPVKGPAKCLIYILSKVFKFPQWTTKFAVALVNISKQKVESVICFVIQKLINLGLFEPRLAIAIALLEEQLFEDKKTEPTPAELLERQTLARKRLSAINKNLGGVMDCIQSPPSNKHLIYTLFDRILAEMYPEVEKMTKDEFHFS